MQEHSSDPVFDEAAPSTTAECLSMPLHDVKCMLYDGGDDEEWRSVH
jgi:hypothetical protein